MLLSKFPRIIFRNSARNYSADLKTAFEEHFIVPDVIDKAPNEHLHITYRKIKVCGQCLKPSETKCKPCVTWCVGKKCDFFTLSMVDPDVPGKECPREREFNHWLVGNIEGQDVRQGCPIVEYLGPLPTHGTGNHRYVFTLYKQKCKIEFEEQTIKSHCLIGRPCFRIRDFAKKYKLGHPVAGMVFVASWECFVDKKKRELAKMKKKRTARDSECE